MSQYSSESLKSLIAGGALGAHVLVKLTSGVLSVAALAEQAIGVMTERPAFAAGDVVPVRLLNCQGTILCKASGAFSQGAVLYGRAGGVVDDISTTGAIAVGIALEAATAANDIVEVLPKWVS